MSSCPSYALHPSPAAIDKPPWPSASPHSATTARAPGGRPCTYLMQQEPSNPLDSIHSKRKSELPHNGARAPQSSACFPAPLLLTHAKLRRRGPVITARAARGGRLGERQGGRGGCWAQLRAYNNTWCLGPKKNF